MNKLLSISVIILPLAMLHSTYSEAQTKSNRTTGSTSICDLLSVKETYPEKDSSLALYDPVIGSWTMKSIWIDKDGARTEGSGQWHFQKTIGGRCIQDVLFSKNAKPYDYGTTIRCYDKSINAWQVSWMQPSSGEFVNCIGRKVGDMIVHQGTVTTPKPYRIRWSFKEITSDSFHWTGEFSEDDGKTWVLEQEMYAERQKSN